jgi:hypothetical protein
VRCGILSRRMAPRASSWCAARSLKNAALSSSGKHSSNTAEEVPPTPWKTNGTIVLTNAASLIVSALFRTQAVSIVDMAAVHTTRVWGDSGTGRLAPLRTRCEPGSGIELQNGSTPSCPLAFVNDWTPHAGISNYSRPQPHAAPARLARMRRQRRARLHCDSVPEQARPVPLPVMLASIVSGCARQVRIYMTSCMTQTRV